MSAKKNAQRQLNTERITQYGILIALALICSYVESLVPPFFLMPGMKLGLTNVVVLVALYRMGDGAAIGINILRVVLVAFLFGNMTSMIYSLVGGFFSTIIMILLKRFRIFGMTAVSVTGGIMHNAGQILVAVILLETTQLWWYMAILWISGMVTGALIGILGMLVVEHLPSSLFTRREGV